MSKWLDVGDLVSVDGRNYLYRIELVNITCDGRHYLCKCLFPRVPHDDKYLWAFEDQLTSQKN